MDAHRTDGVAPVHSEGVSRRELLLGIGAGGLVIAMIAGDVETAAAQDATPAQGGLPPGVGLTPLITIPITDMPTTPFAISLTQLTVDPGSTIPNSSAAWPEIAYVAAGNLTCPGEDGRWVYGPDGKVTASGAGDLAVPKGSAIYVAPNALDGARNDGTEQITALIIDLVPTAGVATPSA